MINFVLPDRLKQTFVMILIAYNNFFYGCLLVFSSVLFTQLRKPTSPIILNTDEESWIASVSSLMSPIGMLVIGILTDKIGRKRALQISFIPIIVSFLILAYSNSYETILIGRTVAGLIYGSDSCIFVYISEICQPDRRQLFFSAIFMFVGIGTLTECVLAMFLHWQTVSLIFAVMATAGMLLLSAIPDSPVWLRSCGRVAEAKHAEQWYGLAPETSSATAVEDGKAVTATDQQDKSASLSPPTFWAVYGRRNVWMPTLITMGLVLCQQGSGLFLVFSYSADLFRDYGVQWDGIFVTFIMSVSRTAGSVAFTLLHDVKRKIMAATSFGVMATSLFVVFVYSQIFQNTERPFNDLVITAAFVTYMFFAILGALPFAWTLGGELFPSDVTGTMNGIVQSCAYVLMFATIKLYPSMVLYLGIEWVWFIFSIICLIGALFSVYIMPETKGIPLNEILARFESSEKVSKKDLT